MLVLSLAGPAWQQAGDMTEQWRHYRNFVRDGFFFNDSLIGAIQISVYELHNFR